MRFFRLVLLSTAALLLAAASADETTLGDGPMAANDVGANVSAASETTSGDSSAVGTAAPSPSSDKPGTTFDTSGVDEGDASEASTVDAGEDDSSTGSDTEGVVDGNASDEGSSEVSTPTPTPTTDGAEIAQWPAMAVCVTAVVVHTLFV